MSRTFALSRVFLTFAALLAVFVFAMPGTAKAASVPTDVCAPGNQYDVAAQTSFANAVQIRLNAANAIADSFGRISNAASACLTNLQNLFSSVKLISNPLGILVNVLTQQIISSLTKVCSTIMSDVNQLKQYLLNSVNQFCIPMPNLQFGLKGLTMTSKPCTGIPLIQAVASPAGSALPSYNYRTLLPQSSGGTSIGQ